MPIPSPPKCPNCGSTDVTLFKSVPHYYGPASTRYNEPKGYTMAFLCVCGMGIAESVKVAATLPARLIDKSQGCETMEASG
jgi:hypothetical protein